MRRYKSFVIFFAVLILTKVVYAQSIKSIRVEGLTRIEVGTVLGYLPMREGDTFTQDKATASLRALFKSGLFKDVKVFMQDDVLVVVVQERPGIASITFSGNKEFSSDLLKNALREIDLRVGQGFNEAIVNTALIEIKRQYLSRGFYSVQINPKIEEDVNGQIQLTFEISEGGVARIQKVEIVGAKAFPESTLLGEIDLSATNWLTWYTKTDQYTQAKLESNVEALRSFYLRRGYLEFRIDASEVMLTPEKDAIHIRLFISEGNQYTIKSIKLEGNYLGKDSEFASLVAIKAGDIYDQASLLTSISALRERFQHYGYAFADVQPFSQLNRAQSTVDFSIRSDPKQRIYVRQINISGNSITSDEVIRREMRQFESSWYDVELIKKSRDRIDRLGLFKSVEITPQDIPDRADQVDLNVKVEERSSTTSINLGATYSTTDKLGIIARYNQENIFGSGNSVSLSINTTSAQNTLSGSVTTPYINDAGWSRTIEISSITTKPLSSQSSSFKTVRQGGSVVFGVPFSEYDRVYFGLGARQYKITLDSGVAQVYQDFVKEFGERSYALPLTVGWQRDSRNSALVPTSGNYQRFYSEYSPAGELKYTSATYQFQEFISLTRKYTLAVNFEVGSAQGIGGASLPYFKYFYVGGLGSVRGYEYGSVGPRDEKNDIIGGAKKLIGNVELLAPFPGAGADKTLRWFVFLDAGRAWSENEAFGKDIRSSYGFGVSWLSPIGPLKFSYGYPIRKQIGDKTETFQFQIGTAF